MVERKLLVNEDGRSGRDMPVKWLCYSAARHRAS